MWGGGGGEMCFFKSTWKQFKLLNSRVVFYGNSTKQYNPLEYLPLDGSYIAITWVNEEVCPV